MKCTICGKEILLVPSAQARADQAKQRGQGAPYDSPSYYTKLFTEHAQCVIEKRSRDTSSLINSLKEATLPGINNLPECPAPLNQHN